MASLVHSYAVAEASDSQPREQRFAQLSHPLAIILSQDCDLDLEYRARNNVAFADGTTPTPNMQIPNILFCDVFLMDDMRTNFSINAGTSRRIKSNNDERYQYLREVTSEEDAEHMGFPALAVDFRRYFTLTIEEVYYQLMAQARRRCRLNTPYMEHLSARFSRYLSRIALPEDHLPAQPNVTL